MSGKFAAVGGGFQRKGTYLGGKSFPCIVWGPSLAVGAWGSGNWRPGPSPPCPPGATGKTAKKELQTREKTQKLGTPWARQSGSPVYWVPSLPPFPPVSLLMQPTQPPSGTCACLSGLALKQQRQQKNGRQKGLSWKLRERGSCPSMDVTWKCLQDANVPPAQLGETWLDRGHKVK